MSSNISLQLRDHLNLQAFFAGVTFMVALSLGGLYIQNQIEITQDNITPLFTSLFTGLAFGHYLGKAVKEQKDSLISAYLGGLIVLSGVALYYLRLKPISGVLVVMTVAIFLSHTSGLINDNKNIQNLVEFVAGDFPPFALFGLGIIRYLIPYALLISNPSDIVSRALDPVVVTVLLLLSLSIYEYMKLRRKTKKIAEYANYMYDLGRKSDDSGQMRDQ